MRLRLAACAIVFTTAMACATVACSSVPDVRYTDDTTAAADGSSSSSTGGDANAPDATGPKPDAAPDTGPPKTCPTTPPSGGVCCGKVPCVGCTTADCGSCNSNGPCDTDKVCCRGNGAGTGADVRCREPTSCK